MQHLSAAFLIIALVIAVNKCGGDTAQDDTLKVDQLAEESKQKSVTIIDGPKYVAQSNSIQLVTNQNNTHKLEYKPSSKPPNITPENGQKYYIEIPRYYGQQHFSKALKLYPPNTVYKYTKVIPLPPNHRSHYYTKTPARQPLVFAASTGRPIIAKSPKFSLPVQTINGIRSDFVRPPKFVNVTTTTTISNQYVETTTSRLPRTKRIWPKRILEKMNTTLLNTTIRAVNVTVTNSTTNATDHDTSESHYRIRFVHPNKSPSTTTSQPPTTRGYRRVTRVPKIKSTTPFANTTHFLPNDWVPIIPSHYSKGRRPKPKPISKRSDTFFYNTADTENSPDKDRLLYLQSYGLLPMSKLSGSTNHLDPAMSRKKMVFFRKRRRQVNPYAYSGFSSKHVRAPSQYLLDDLQTEASHHKHPKVYTKIKHHHHHHHHRYVKTVEKPVKVPYKVIVPKPYPVTVEKKVEVPVEKIKVVEKPVPYPVEKKVPFPVGIKIPHPVPYKVVEKEYVPKPYPVVQHVPVVKHVKVPHPVPYPVEKKVPYPVQVKVPYPVDRPVPVPVQVERQVPYPVPVKVLVPQPYPVETKVPYPVQVKVKEPYEVIKHVPVRVPVPQPYPVRVPHPVQVTVEKKVPYPVEVEKKVPVPVEILVPHRVEVEKRVPVYVPKPYPVEKKVPVPVRVPYPVRVPVRVPVEVPVEVPVYFHHPYQVYSEDQLNTVGSASSAEEPVTSTPQHTVTVHGNTGFAGFHSRSDKEETTTQSTPKP